METNVPAQKKKQLIESTLLIFAIILLTTVGLLFLSKHAEPEGNELMKPADEASHIYRKVRIQDCVNSTESHSPRLVMLMYKFQTYN